jgi:hypothetical protein
MAGASGLIASVVDINVRAVETIERSMAKTSVAKGRDPDYLLSVLKTKLESEPLFESPSLAGYGDRVALTIPLVRLVPLALRGQ